MSKEKKRRTGFRHVKVTSTVSMSLVLFLVGLVFMLLFVARDMSTYVKENINLSVILEDSITQAEEQRIEKYLTNAQYAKSVEYISKEVALKDHISNLGDNPQEFLGYNPLKASIEVKLNAKYANTDSVQMIESNLKKFENINRVVYQKDIVGLVNENVQKISLVLLGLALILLFVSVALFNNTIRLSLYSNRFIINTMKLVGATPWFIRRPYMISSMINGLVASFISIFLLVGVVAFVQYEFGIPDILVQSANLISVGFIIVALGLFLTALSSYLSVGRYLRMNSNDLHVI